RGLFVLVPGRYRVDAGLRSRDVIARAGVVERVEFAYDRDGEIELPPGLESVQVRLRPVGAPPAGRWNWGRATWFAMPAGGQRRHAFLFVPAGTYEVLYRQHETEGFERSAGTVTVTSGTVAAAAHVPPPGAVAVEVHLTVAPGWRPRTTVELSSVTGGIAPESVRTDRFRSPPEHVPGVLGVASLLFLDRGCYRLRVSAAGFLPFESDVVVGETTVRIEANLQPDPAAQR
ncbi:MAG: hypothetical protein ACREID_01250, partial [Planctomycetota bacterium]